ncbi:MAG TPA: phosphoribosylglycinamide formyltransferase [Gemmatimonadales bacterium]|nr:phosphoribosylglycinamide formyltransferase [Gemmatimonadales bacterium]
MVQRVAVCVSGRGSNLAALLASLAPGAPAEVVLVISNRAEAGALALARERGLATHVLAATGDAEEWLQQLASHRVDLVVLAGFLALVPPDVVRAYTGRMINIHPALLPKHGGPGMYGRRVHAAVLAAGDTESGATVHGVTEAYDEGPVLGQARVPVLAGDTPERLAARVLEAEHQLLPAAVLAAARAGRAVPFTLSPSAAATKDPACPAP